MTKQILEIPDTTSLKQYSSYKQALLNKMAAEMGTFSIQGDHSHMVLKIKYEHYNMV